VEPGCWRSRICRTAWLAPEVSWYRSILVSGSTLRCTHPRFTHLRSTLSAADVPASSLKPGLYTCQINVIDDAAGTFSFPRLQLYVRP